MPKTEIRSLVLGVACLATMARLGFAQAQAPEDVAKAMMAEAIIRACPTQYRYNTELRSKMRALLAEDPAWSKIEIEKQARKFRTAGCGSVSVFYSNYRDRYPYIAPSGRAR
jgi:hypothetical protein